jgi:hypothetical protein
MDPVEDLRLVAAAVDVVVVKHQQTLLQIQLSLLLLEVLVMQQHQLLLVLVEQLEQTMRLLQLTAGMELHLEWAAVVGDQHKPLQKLVTAVMADLLLAVGVADQIAQVSYLVMVVQVVTVM